FAQLALEKRHPDAVALFWAGCGADQNPLPRRNVLLAQKYGDQLADSVDAVLNGAMKPVNGFAGATYKEIDLPFSELPERDSLVQATMSKNKFIAARATILSEDLAKKGASRGIYPYLLHSWR